MPADLGTASRPGHSLSPTRPTERKEQNAIGIQAENQFPPLYPMTDQFIIAHRILLYQV
jgi:hypothetical protein